MLPALADSRRAVIGHIRRGWLAAQHNNRLQLTVARPRCARLGARS